MFYIHLEDDMKKHLILFVVIACLCILACSTKDKPEAVEEIGVERVVGVD